MTWFCFYHTLKGRFELILIRFCCLFGGPDLFALKFVLCQVFHMFFMFLDISSHFKQKKKFRKSTGPISITLYTLPLMIHVWQYMSKILVCPGGVPLPVPLYTPLPYGGKFWWQVLGCATGNTQFFALLISWRRCVWCMVTLHLMSARRQPGVTFRNQVSGARFQNHASDVISVTMRQTCSTSLHVWLCMKGCIGSIRHTKGMIKSDLI